MTAPDWHKIATTHKHLVRAMEAYPDTNWHDATSDGQLQSKLWLIEQVQELGQPMGNVLVVGGWVGFLPLLMLQIMPDRCDRIISLDKDATACAAAQMLLKTFVMDGLRAFAICGDALDFDYAGHDVDYTKSDGSRIAMEFSPKTIINTSWEHFDDPESWFALLPRRRLVCIQANANWDAAGHVACPADLADLCARTPFHRRFYASERQFGDSKRLMTIGLT